MKIKIGSGIWLLVGLLVCVAILLLGLFLIVFPVRSEISDVETQIEGVETGIAQEQSRLTQLQQYEKDPEQFTRQIDVLKERVPETVELADIIQQIDHAAEEAGLDFANFTPQIPVQAESLYVVTCSATFNGRYFNLIEFLNHIERLPRSVKIVSIDLSGGDEGLPYLGINITFRAYFTTNAGVQGLVTGGT